MKDKMEKWLEGEGISYRSISDLPSEYYADASHPLKEGYAKIAEELLETESFRIWMKNWHVSNFLKN
jgi:lysophospholipase L1-like esterase